MCQLLSRDILPWRAYEVYVGVVTVVTSTISLPEVGKNLYGFFFCFDFNLTLSSLRSSCACCTCDAQRFVIRLLYTCDSGDIDRQLPPPTETALCVVHVNVGSLGKKLDFFFKAERKHFDSITRCETWLSKRDNNHELHPPAFSSTSQG